MSESKAFAALHNCRRDDQMLLLMGLRIIKTEPEGMKLRFRHIHKVHVNA